MIETRKVSVWLPYYGAGASHFFGTVEEVKQEIFRRNPLAADVVASRIDELAATVGPADYQRLDLHTGEPDVHALPSVQLLPSDPETRASPDGRTYRLIKPGTIFWCDTQEVYQCW